jgi:hypothetical protein
LPPPEPTEQPEQLLKELKETPPADLAASVQRTESVAVGATLEPVYGRRKMRLYAVTESELSQIGLANLLATICIGLGSALVGFGIDIFKDTILTSELPNDAALVAKYVQRLCLFLGLGFYVGAGAIYWWRKGLLETIKSEQAH